MRPVYIDQDTAPLMLYTAASGMTLAPLREGRLH